MTASRAAPSTRCCARATPTAARPPPSKITRARIRTAWARGRPTRRPTWRTCRTTTSVRPSARRSSARRIAADRAGRRGRQSPPSCASRCRCSRARSWTPRSCAPRRCASFCRRQVARAKTEGVLFSVHLKATMMKVSDPIIFGHAVRAFFPKTFAQYGDALAGGRLEPERRSRQRSSRA